MADVPLEKEEGAAIDQTAFETIERDFQDVLKELAGDRSLEKFRGEYEKLHMALRKSYENEKRLIKRVKELGTEIVQNASKIQTALKLSKEDQSTIASLRLEIEKAWKMVDSSKEKEVLAKQTIDTLRSEINSLTALVEQTSGISVGEENTLKELLLSKEKLLAERNSQMDEITQLRAQLTEYVEKLRLHEVDRVNMENNINMLRDIIAAKKTEATREKRKRELIEKELMELKTTNETNETRIRELEGRCADQSQEQKEHIKELKELKERIASSERNLKKEEAKTIKANTGLNEQLRLNEILRNNIADKEKEERFLNSQLTNLRQELEELKQQRSKVATENEKLVNSRELLKGQKEALKAKIEELDNEILSLKRDNTAEATQAATLVRDNCLLDRDLKKSTDVQRGLSEDVNVLELTIAQLNQEISTYKYESQKQRSKIHDLESEREKLSVANAAKAQEMLRLNQEITVRETTISDLTNKIKESEIRLKQQHNLYEAVRSDRNLYSKNLISSQNEIAEMNRKFRIMQRIVEQLKEEIKIKEAGLNSEFTEKKMLQKEKDNLVMNNGILKTQGKLSQQEIASLRGEISKMSHAVSVLDKDKGKLATEYKTLLKERDVIGSQLIRRNDELNLLYEKCRILEAQLHKGEQAYSDRVDDIRRLLTQLTDAKRTSSCLFKDSAALEAYKRETMTLKRELLDERAKCRALEDDLKNPLNVHRWRQLEGQDPQTFDLLKKVQALQKRLIEKAELAAKRESDVEACEGRIRTLKNILARQPGPETLEQLAAYESSIEHKRRQIKTLGSELIMYKTQAEEARVAMERMASELTDMKRRYYIEKNKNPK